MLHNVVVVVLVVGGDILTSRCGGISTPPHVRYIIRGIWDIPYAPLWGRVSWGW